MHRTQTRRIANCSISRRVPTSTCSSVVLTFWKFKQNATQRLTASGTKLTTWLRPMATRCQRRPRYTFGPSWRVLTWIYGAIGSENSWRWPFSFGSTDQCYRPFQWLTSELHDYIKTALHDYHVWTEWTVAVEMSIWNPSCVRLSVVWLCKPIACTISFRQVCLMNNQIHQSLRLYATVVAVHQLT